MSFGSGYKGTKLKTNLRLAINRLKLMEKKKTELAQKARKDIADYISQGKDERARIRVEHIIREDYLVEAMELLEMYCDLLLARFGLIESMKTLDDGLAESISTVIWAAPRMQTEVPEIRVVAEQLCCKYGKEYGKMARSNQTGTVNERFMHKLSPQPPPKILVERYLQEIAKSHNVPYEPDPSVLMESSEFNDMTADDLLLLDVSSPSNPPPGGSASGGGGYGGNPGGGYGGNPGGGYGGNPGGGYGGNSGGGFGGNPGGGYGGNPGGGYGGNPGGGFGGYGGGGGGGGGMSQPVLPANAVPSVGPTNSKMPFAYPSSQPQNAPTVPPPPANYVPPPQQTSKKGGPPPLPSRPPAGSTNVPPAYNGQSSSAPSYETAMRDSVYPPPTTTSYQPTVPVHPSAPVPSTPQPPPPDAGPLPPKDSGIPDLPSVPANSLPSLDNTIGSSSAGGEDVDFDDLTRRFEELKKKK